MDLGFPEIALILLIVLIIFGAGKLPQVGGALGKAIREFKREKDGLNEQPQTANSHATSVSSSQAIEVKAETAKKS